MKKLLVSLGAAGLTFGALADIGYVTEGCDLATFNYTSDHTYWGLVSQTGGHQDYWTTADVDIPYEIFWVFTHDDPGTASSATIDLQGHTWYQAREGFFLRANCDGADPYSQPGATLTITNGTLDGKNTYTLQMGGFWDSSGINGHYLLDTVNITNFPAFAYGSEMASSDITLPELQYHFWLVGSVPTREEWRGWPYHYLRGHSHQYAG